MGVDYGEILCTAVDEIVTTRLAGLSYDLTKLCTIVDDSYAYQGKYVVSDGTARYEAFTTDNSLTKGNNVLVTIPNGDYSLQKIIKGRVAATDTTPFKYQSPLKTMIKVTNDILNSPQATDVIADKGLLANGRETLLGPIYSIKNATKLSGYTRFGISADFRSLLDGLDVVSGTYGLKILVRGQTVVRPGEYNQQVYELDFNSFDMVGNPYQFGVYFTQEKVFDISFINNIEDIEIYFFQGNNFIDGSGERISTINVAEIKNFKNLFVDNVQIYLGYDVNEFDKETLMLHTDNMLSYQYTRQNNEKDVYLRWIHLEEDQSPVMINSDDVKDGASKRVQWYRYSPGCENIDKYGGKNWEPVVADTSNALHYHFLPNIKKKTEQIKAVGFIYSNEKVGEENIKQAYYSNILIFENEEDVPDETTKDASVGLTIECLDDSEGNYFIYNQNGKINNEGLGQGYERRFKAMFNGAEISGTLGTLDWIKWYIPEEGQTKSSMILTNDEQRTENHGNVLKNGAQYRTNSYWEITRKPKEKVIPQEFASVEQAYCISNQWTIQKFNNLVICRASINGVEYEAKKQLNFGKAGTNGTNLTLVMEFTENQNALIINDQKIKNSDGEETETYKENTITVNTYIYDNAEGKIQAILNPNDVKYSWYKGYHLETDPKDNTKQIQVNPYINLARSSVEGSIEAVLTCKTNTLPKDNYSILQVTYKNLIAYLPIPLKTRDTSFMEGAREIIYDHQGIPSYYTGRYLLHYFDKFQNKYDKYDKDYKHNVKLDRNVTDWVITNKENVNKDDKITIDYVPKLQELSSLKGFGLIAPPFFAENFNNEVCISLGPVDYTYYEKDVLGDPKKDSYNTITLGWSQPILMMQSKYDFALLNDWDGSLTLNEKDGIILSTMLGAGRKNSNNTFSGVLIGDIKAGTGLDTTQKATGVYGIHEGQLSYGFRDNGTGFIGKSGHGQILLDGNTSVIRNAGYLLTEKVKDENEKEEIKDIGTGMQIDLDNGIIDIKNKGKSKIYISPNLSGKDGDKAYFTINGTHNTLMHIYDDSYYLQSDNYQNDDVAKKGSNFDLVNGTLVFRSSNGNVTLSGDSSDGKSFLLVNTINSSGKNSPILKFSSTEQFLKSPPITLNTLDPETIKSTDGTKIYTIYKTKAGTDTDNPSNRLTLVKKAEDGSTQYRTIGYFGQAESDYSRIILTYNSDTGKYSIGDAITEEVYTSDSIYTIASNAEQVYKTVEEQKGLSINLKTGYIQGYDLTLKGRQSESSNYFLLDSTAKTYPFVINDSNFKVSWAGDLYCNKVKSLTNDGSGKVISITNNFQVNSSGEARGTGCNFGGSFNGGFSGTGALTSMSLGGKNVSTKKIDIGQPTWKVNTSTVNDILTKWSLYGPLTDMAGQTFYAFSSNDPKGQVSVKEPSGMTQTNHPSYVTVLSVPNQ